MEKDTETIRTSLRIPKPLYDQLHKAAQERGMTMHAEMITRLEESFASLEMSDQQIEAMAELIAKRVSATMMMPVPPSNEPSRTDRGTRVLDLDDK